jgi:hypothetical protein
MLAVNDQALQEQLACPSSSLPISISTGSAKNSKAQKSITASYGTTSHDLARFDMLR